MKKFCAHCEKPFQSQRNSRLYCSDNCKQYAFYKRNASMSQGRDIGSVSLLEESNAKDVRELNRNDLINQLSTILISIIDEEIERRIAQRPHAATVTESLNVNRNVIANDNQDDECTDDATVNDNEGDTLQNNDREDESSAEEPYNVNRNIALNGKQREYTHKVELDDDEADVNDTMEESPADTEGDALEDDGQDEEWPVSTEGVSLKDASYADELSVIESYSVKRHVTLNDNNTSANDNAANDQMIEGIKNQKGEHLRGKFSGVDREQNNGPAKPLNVNRNVAEKEPVNVKEPYAKKHLHTANSNSLNEDQEIKPHNGVDENWVFSTFTRDIHDYKFYYNDYSKFTDNNGSKVLEVFKCLAKHLLCHSNRKPISRHNLLVLTKIFTKLTKSNNFSYLSGRFPHYNMIVSLTEKLQALEKVSRTQEV